MQVEGQLAQLLADANAAVAKLAVAAEMVPSPDWFLYGFVRKEAVMTSQIEGTQATLQEVVEFEATAKADRLDDVQEVCNYVDALNFVRREIRRPKGLPLSMRLLCAAHKRLMRGVRGSEKLPGEVRSSQNWVGGTRPGNARFVPPPPDDAKAALAELDQRIHRGDPLPPLIKAGLAHVQFETIHPFLDGNGRIGRLLIALLVEHWHLLPLPILERAAEAATRRVLPTAHRSTDRRRLGGLVTVLTRMRFRGGGRRRQRGAADLCNAQQGPASGFESCQRDRQLSPPVRTAH